MIHLTTIKSESIKNKNSLRFCDLELGSFFHIRPGRRPGVYVKTARLTAFCMTYNKKVIIKQEQSATLIDDLEIQSV
jgi:hypothetical protein